MWDYLEVIVDGDNVVWKDTSAGGKEHREKLFSVSVVEGSGHSVPSLATTLMSLGIDNWELVGSIWIPGSTAFRYHFKRPTKTK